jgi:repressor LexA
MLTEKQHQLLMFIDERLSASGVAPSFEEMKNALGLHSKSGVHRLVKALEERGFIRRLPHRARALEILRLPSDATIVGRPAVPSGAEAENVVSANFGRPKKGLESVPMAEAGIEIPLHGKIAAGTPIEALQNTDQMIAVPPQFIGRGNHFALEISGDSMIELGILDGDTAIIRSTETAENGDIVVALLDKEEATLKTLHKRGDQIALRPANPAFSTQILPASRVQIQGRLVGLLRNY